MSPNTRNTGHGKSTKKPLDWIAWPSHGMATVQSTTCIRVFNHKLLLHIKWGVLSTVPILVSQTGAILEFALNFFPLLAAVLLTQGIVGWPMDLLAILAARMDLFAPSAVMGGCKSACTVHCHTHCSA